MSVKRLVALVVLFASTAHADVTRPQVNFALAKAVADIRACGRRYTASFDWTAYDAVDWSKTDKTKQKWLEYEPGTLENLGAGVNRVCADPDYKAVLGGIDTIVYRITDDRNLELSARIDGKTLVFTNYTFDGTRDASDFEEAARSACEAAALPAVPAAPTAPVVKPAPSSAPAKAAPPSTAWDGTYTLKTPGSRYICPNPDGLNALKVARGKLSLEWIADDERLDKNQPVRVGHIDATARADGTVAATATFDAPIWQSTIVGRVKLKREFDASDVKMSFSRDTDGIKLLTLTITFSPDESCDVIRWESGSPKWVPPPPVRGNPFPEYGPRFDTEHYRTVDEYDSDTVYTRGTVVWRAIAAVGIGPYMLYYRCTQAKCSSSLSSADWAPAGWQ